MMLCGKRTPSPNASTSPSSVSRGRGQSKVEGPPGALPACARAWRGTTGCGGWRPAPARHCTRGPQRPTEPARDVAGAALAAEASFRRRRVGEFFESDVQAVPLQPNARQRRQLHDCDLAIDFCSTPARVENGRPRAPCIHASRSRSRSSARSMLRVSSGPPSRLGETHFISFMRCSSRVMCR